MLVRRLLAGFLVVRGRVLAFSDRQDKDKAREDIGEEKAKSGQGERRQGQHQWSSNKDKTYRKM